MLPVVVQADVEWVVNANIEKHGREVGKKKQKVEAKAGTSASASAEKVLPDNPAELDTGNRSVVCGCLPSISLLCSDTEEAIAQDCMTFDFTEAIGSWALDPTQDLDLEGEDMEGEYEEHDEFIDGMEEEEGEGEEVE